MKLLPSRLPVTPAVLAVIAAVLALVAGAAWWVLDDEDEVVNEAGGYSVVVPEDWAVQQKDRTTTLSSPDKEVVIRFGLGEQGPLPEAAALFFQRVGRNYRDVHLLGVQAEQVGPRLALAHAGLGTNDRGVRLRFLAITVQNQPRNFGITVFTPANSDPLAVLPRVNRVVETFRAPPDSRWPTWLRWLR